MTFQSCPVKYLNTQKQQLNYFLISLRRLIRCQVDIEFLHFEIGRKMINFEKQHFFVISLRLNLFSILNVKGH